ncbi:MAG: DUF4215 domain-containing protein [Patescibacteria group bacterium]
MFRSKIPQFFLLASLGWGLFVPTETFAVATSSPFITFATTTLTISVCGNTTVDAGEDCDVPGEVGTYSTTIAGRQCNAQCQFGPYCGDGILQTVFDEECDDGNNDDGDFCSSICKIEPAGSGGGGSSGGGSRSGGGSDDELNETQISIEGLSYPSQTVNILLDGDSVGTVQADNDGEFDFTVEASPGASSLGFWVIDRFGTRSLTLNTTFDVTQGAVTNLSNILIPPTITVDNQNIDPGDTITLFGQSVPDTLVEIHFNESEIVESVQSESNGNWTLDFDTGRLPIAEHIVRSRSVLGSTPLTTESTFSSSLQLFVGVEGQATTPSDLNRDGFVNLTDFSILIFWWQSNGGESDPPADINGNGNVGIEDFSILLFNWSG